MEATEPKKCRARWAGEKRDRMSDLRKLWRAHQQDSEAEVADIGKLYEYGLGFDYVAPGTFNGQRRGYWRWQLSWGGPSDEFRFYADGPECDPHRIEYVFLDWFDGHARKLRGHDESLLCDLWHWFADMGSTQVEYDKAMGEA